MELQGERCGEVVQVVAVGLEQGDDAGWKIQQRREKL
jgi:hypothetical protein